MRIHGLAITALMLIPRSGAAQTYNIREFGAVADGVTLNTASIQRAIDACADAGGGEVLVPAGVFLSGSVRLKSNVLLHLTPGAVLQGSDDPADYPDHDISTHEKYGTITHDGQHVQFMRALVIADGAQNVGLIGAGTLRGAGDAAAFQLGINKDGKPKNVFCIGCSHVRLAGVRILNAAQVTVSISGCDHVTIDGLYVRSLTNWNCDGLDIDARNVTVSNCIIESEDDALCLKSEYLGRFCENVTISNCVVASICNGIKLGTGSRCGFRNVTVSNCVIRSTGLNDYFHWKMTSEVVHRETETSVNTGIVILGVDGGLVENIRFSDIVMTDVLSPIFIRVGRRFLSPEQQPSVMRNISIQNVTAHTRSILPSIVAGLEESPARDIRLSNIRISNPIGVPAERWATFPAQPPENLKSYPENRLTFGLQLPAAAIYVRHVEGISLSDISVTGPAEEARPAVAFDDVRGIKVRSVRMNDRDLSKEPSQIGLNDSSEVEFVE